MGNEIELLSLKCPSCGASLEDFQDKTEVECEFCHNVTQIIRPTKVVVNTTKILESDSLRLNNITAIMEKSMIAGNYKEAYDYCNKGLEIDPESSALWENKAICRFQLDPFVETIESNAKEIVTYLNAAKVADPDSKTYAATSKSLASNIFNGVKYRYLLKNFDIASNGKERDSWSGKSKNEIIHYLKLMRVCYGIYPNPRYLDMAIRELTNLGKIKNWINISKTDVSNASWLEEFNFDAVKTREKYIAELHKNDSIYSPPTFPKEETSNSFGVILGLICVVIIGFVVISKMQPSKSATSAESSASSSNNMETSKVVSLNGLNLRVDHGSNGKVLLTIPYNGTIEIIDKTGPSEMISGKTANWYEVEYNGTRGWVWSGNLAQ